MVLARRRPKNKRSVLIKFQPWLTAGAVVLNLAATGSAAVSAYYSSKQSELATEAVNRQSRNEAFSELIKAYDALCSVSVGPSDQSYFLDFVDGKAVATADFDAIEANRSKVDVDAYLAEWQKQFAEIYRRHLFLRIWLSEQERQEIADALPDPQQGDYYEDFLKRSLSPPQVEIFRNNVSCRMTLNALVEYFENRQPEGSLRDHILADEVLIYPYSSSEKSLDEMLKVWGLENSAEILKKYQ